MHMRMRDVPCPSTQGSGGSAKARRTAAARRLPVNSPPPSCCCPPVSQGSQGHAARREVAGLWRDEERHEALQVGGGGGWGEWGGSRREGQLRRV